MTTKMHQVYIVAIDGTRIYAVDNSYSRAIAQAKAACDKYNAVIKSKRGGK